MDELTGVCRRVTLVGTMSDALPGRGHAIEEAVEIAAVWADTVTRIGAYRTTTSARITTSSSESESRSEQIHGTMDRAYWRMWPWEPPSSDAPDD